MTNEHIFLILGIISPTIYLFSYGNKTTFHLVNKDGWQAHTAPPLRGAPSLPPDPPHNIEKGSTQPRRGGVARRANNVSTFLFVFLLWILLICWEALIYPVACPGLQLKAPDHRWGQERISTGKSRALPFGSAPSSPRRIRADATPIRLSISRSILPSLEQDPEVLELLHLGQDLIPDPESAPHPFAVEDHGLRFGGADSHPGRFTLGCEPVQRESEITVLMKPIHGLVKSVLYHTLLFTIPYFFTIPYSVLY